MEQLRRSAPLVGALAALSLLTSACAPQAAPASGAPIPSRHTARIGAALSLTGPAHLFGIAQRSGIKLAQDEINTNHALGNTKLEVVIQDDASDREQSTTVFQRFIEDGQVVAIMGPTLTDAALSVDPLAQQAGIPVLAVSNSASSLTAIGNFIFRESLSESQLSPQVIKQVRSRFTLPSAALLYSDTDPNRSGSHGFKAALQNAGVQIALEETFSKDQTDFSAELDEIAATRPGALFVTAPSSSAAAILVQARQHGLDKTPIIGSSAFNSDSVLRSAGEAAEGLIVGSAWSLETPSARNQEFIQNYRARFGVDPDQLAAQAYAGVYILAAALRSAHTVSDPRAVRDALEQITSLDTPLGPFSFNDAHEAAYPPIVQIVHLGRLQPF